MARSNMQESGMNIDSSGGVISAENMREQRRKKGQCTSCGQKCHDKRLYPFKSTPLTIPGLVHNGRCLICDPFNEPSKPAMDLGRAVSSIEVANTLTKKIRKKHSKTRAASMIATDPNSSARRDASLATANAAHRRDSAGHGPGDRLTAMNTVKVFKSTSVIPTETESIRTRRSRKKSSEASLIPKIENMKLGPNVHENARNSDHVEDLRSISNDENTEEKKEPKPSDGLQALITRKISQNSTETNQSRNSISNNSTSSNSTSSNNNSNNIEPHIRTIRNSSSATEITNIMRQNINVIDLQREGLKALGSLVLSQSDQASLTNQSVMKSIVDAMLSYPYDQSVQEAACRALWNLSAIESNQIEIVRSGGVDAIVNSMKHFKTSSNLQERAVAALSNLGAAEENQLIILEQGGVHAIIDAMNKNLDEINIQEKGCAAITNLASRSSEIKSGIAEAEGITAILHAMMFHEADPELQENALRALRNLCANDENNKKLVAAEGGISYVICAMQNHRNHTGLQEQGCWTLSNLAANRENKAFIGENGGIDCIVLAMWNHFDKANVQEWGCRALWTLSVDVNNKAIVVKIDGIRAVVNAMRTHQNEAAIQEKGCGVFSTLASNSDENKIQIVRDDGLDAIVMAMVIHQDNKLVQERACSALKRLACQPNIPSFQTFGVPNVLLQAKENFPNDCGKKVDEIMQMIYAE